MGRTQAGRTKQKRNGRALLGIYEQRSSYHVSLYIDGRQVHCGTWPTHKAAALARDRALLHFGYPTSALKYPVRAARLGALAPTELQKLAQREKKQKQRSTSRYFGVSYMKNRETWNASLKLDGKNIHIGAFHDELEAAIARDRVARSFRNPRVALNFADEDLSPATPEEVRPEFVRPRLRKSHGALGLVGVVHRRRGKWCAALTDVGESHYLGEWPTPEDAAFALASPPSTRTDQSIM
jgi:hypothetical protein